MHSKYHVSTGLQQNIIDTQQFNVNCPTS